MNDSENWIVFIFKEKMTLKQLRIVRSSDPSPPLITHFVWYLEKEKRHGIETLYIDRVLNKEHLYGKIMQNMCTKSFFNLISNPKQPWHARYFDKRLSISLKKINFIFSFESKYFNGQSYQEQKGLTSCSSGKKTSSEKLVIYYLTNFHDVI